MELLASHLRALHGGADVRVPVCTSLTAQPVALTRNLIIMRDPQLAALTRSLINTRDPYLARTDDFTRHMRREAAVSTHVSSATDVVIIDGIFVLAVESVRAACDLTLFTIEDLDVCLARRLRRDIAERGRDVGSVLEQYLKFVKPGFQNFIAPSMNKADILVPRARDNLMAIEMIAKEVQRRVENEAGRALAGVPHTPRAIGIELAGSGRVTPASGSDGGTSTPKAQ